MATLAEGVKRSKDMTGINSLDAATKLKEQRDAERAKVKGIFRFHEVPGGEMGFIFKKYKGDPLEKFNLKDGEVYTLPLGVARHLNTNCWYPVYSHSQLNEQGNTELVVKEKIRRCSFQSLEFLDIDESQKAQKI